MDFRELSNSFGGCIFGDDLRLDLLRVEKDIERLRLSVNSLQSVDDHAAFHLRKAVFHLAQGKYAAGLAALQEIEVAEQNLSKRWRARRRAYRALARYLQRTPPITRFRPDNHASSSIIADAMYQIRNIKSEFEYLVAQLEQDPTPYCSIDKLELECLQYATTRYNDFLWVHAVFHPSYPQTDVKKAILQQPYTALLRDLEAFPAFLIQRLRDSQLDVTAEYFEMLNIQAMYVKGVEDAANSRFTSLVQGNSVSQNYLSRAAACIMLGDHLYSAPTTSIISFNLVLEGTLTGYENAVWDTFNFEESHRAKRNKIADERYEQALKALKMMRGARGMGAIYLRKACILHIESFSIRKSNHEAEATNKRDEAHQNLNDAEECFQHDFNNLQLVKAHRVLLEITTGEHQDVVSEARKIGIDCKENDNCQLSRFIGLMMLRFGRRQWMDNGPPGIFQICCECAKACFEGSDDKIYLYQAEIAFAKLRCHTGALPSAQESLRRGRELLNQAIEELTKLQNTTPHDAGLLKSVEGNLQGHFFNVEESIRKKASDPSTFTSSMPELIDVLPSTYISKASHSTAVLSRVSKNFVQAHAEALERLSSADFEGFLSRMEGFLVHLLDSFDTNEQSVAGFQVRTLCLLGRYSEARIILPVSIPTLLGGTGTNELFDSIPSVQIKEAGGYTLSAPKESLLQQLERAMGNCVWAKDWWMATQVISTALKSDPHLIYKLADSSHQGKWQMLAELAAVYEQNGGLEEALTWYLRAAEALETHRSQAVEYEGRLSTMSSVNSTELFAGLILVALRMHRAAALSLHNASPANHGLPGEDWQSQALLFAEQSRARLLLDMLTLENNASAQQFQKWRNHSYIYRQYYDLLHNLRPGRNITDSTRNRIALELEDLRDRQQKEFDSGNGQERLWSAAYILLATSTLQWTASSLFQAINTNTLVLHCNIAEDQTVIFAVSAEGILRIKEIDLSRRTLQRRVLAYQEMMARSKPNDGTADRELADTTGSFLASHLLLPFQDLITAKRHIIFVPSHELHTFPLCSLPFHGQPLCLQKTCSTIPSLTVLQQLVRHDNSRNGKKASLLLNRRKDIQMASVGASAIGRFLEAHGMEVNEKSATMFGKGHDEASLVFVSTHGLAAVSGYSPWQARLMMPLSSGEAGQSGLVPEHLRVLDLANFHTQAAVVVFSACLAGLGEITQGNDVIGFSHAILESGAQAYIGALWSVSDWATMLLMFLFHKALVTSDNLNIADSLHTAQLEFFNLTTDKAIALVEDVKGSWERSNEVLQTPEHLKGWVKSCRPSLRELIDDFRDDDITWDFKDPFFWAPWVVVGHGHARLINERQSVGPSKQIPRFGGIGMESPPMDNKTPHQESTDAIEGIQRTTTVLSDSSITSPGPPMQRLQYIHSVDSSGLLPRSLPGARFSPTLRGQTTLPYILPPPPPSPPPPQLPPRPSASPRPTHNAASQPPLLPRRPVDATPPKRPTHQTQNPVGGQNTQRSLPSANPEQHAALTPMYFPPPPRSPNPGSNPRGLIVQPQQDQRRRTPVPTPSEHRYTHAASLPPQKRNSNTPNPSAPPPYSPGFPTQNQPYQPQQFHPPPALPSQQQPPQFDRRVSLGGPATAAHVQQDQQRRLRQQQQQPAKSGPSKMKRFMNHPGTKIAMRLGTGMLIGGLVDGAVGDVGDMDFGGGDGDFGGGDGGDFAGDAGGGEYGYNGAEGGDYSGGADPGRIYGEPAAAGGGYQADIMAQGMEFQHQMTMDSLDGTGAYDAAGGGGGGGGGPDGDLPGQVGPCFEDNIILSRAAG